MTVRGARIRWRRALLATVMVGASFTYVAATFVDLEDPLYTAKWLSCAAILVALLACARWHFATDHVYPFALVVAMVTLGLVAQIGDNIDMRAMQVAFGLTLTAVGAFLIAPPALQRRWVRATVWPALLLGVTAGLVAGMVLGLLHPERAFLIDLSVLDSPAPGQSARGCARPVARRLCAAVGRARRSARGSVASRG